MVYEISLTRPGKKRITDFFGKRLGNMHTERDVMERKRGREGRGREKTAMLSEYN